MNTCNSAVLEFDPGRAFLRDGLSAVLQVGNTLWVANDETVSLERLTRLPDNEPGVYRYGQHGSFPLSDYLELPAPPPDDTADFEEVDIEGLACAGGYLWLVGSHSLKRKKPKREDPADESQRKLAKVSSDGNRYLLARIPLLETASGGSELAKHCSLGGKDLFAARLHGDDKGSELTRALQKDKHLGPFLGIPGKDNGFDIEGMVVVDERIFIGLRGPVLRGWAVILEIAVEADEEKPSTLRLRDIGPNGRPYRKHFLHLGGLGIRDLCVQGSDLLILAGPTMDLDGPVTIFRWRGGSKPDDEAVVSTAALQRVLDVPYGDGDDHAEGMTLLAPDSGHEHSLLVIYDAASQNRKSGESVVTVDILKLP